MNESLVLTPLAGMAGAAARALRRFRAALATALVRADDGAVEPFWADGMSSRAQRHAPMRTGELHRSAVFDEWMIWRG